MVAQVKDTVFDGPAGQVTGFTLSGRGLLAGPLRRSLPWASVHALGRHAVMIRGAEVLAERSAVVARREAAHGRLVGARVLTDEGTEIGVVLDVVVEAGTSGRVVGFRLDARESLVTGSRRRRRQVFVPRGETLAVSGRALVVPRTPFGSSPTTSPDSPPASRRSRHAANPRRAVWRGGRCHDDVLPGPGSAGGDPG